MAKKSTITASKSESASTSPIVGTVWRFVDYEARWGGATNGQGKKITVPKYVKWYMNAWEGCEGDVVSALEQLRADPDFIWLQGVLVELLTRATNTSPKYQGYLLTSRKDPASAAEIGRILRLKGKGSNRTALGVLRKLANAGFLERVELPGSPPPVAGKGPEKKKVGNGRAGSGRKGGKRANKAGSRAKNEASLLKGKSKSKVCCADKETRSTPDPVQAQRARCIEQVNQMQGNDEANASAGGNPAGSPTSSTKFDEPGRVRQQAGRVPARPSISPSRGILPLSEYRYSTEAWAFADDLVIRSGFLHPTAVKHVRSGKASYNPDQQCERAHWAKAYDEAAETFPSPVIAQLRTAIDKRADEVRTRRHTLKKPEAYLMRAWFNLVKDQKRRGKAIG